MCWLCVSGCTWRQMHRNHHYFFIFRMKTHPTGSAVNIEGTPVEHFRKAGAHVHLWSLFRGNQHWMVGASYHQRLESVLENLRSGWKPIAGCLGWRGCSFLWAGTFPEEKTIWILDLTTRVLLFQTSAWEELWVRRGHFHGRGFPETHAPENLPRYRCQFKPWLAEIVLWVGAWGIGTGEQLVAGVAFKVWWVE